MKIKTGLSFLLMATLGIVTLGRAQDATTTSATSARRYETGGPLQDYLKNSAPIPDPGNSLLSAWSMDRTIQWKIHLALRLATREWNRKQVRIILDALSLSSAETLAVTNHGPANKADATVQALRQRARAAFSKKEATDLFAHIAGAKADDDVLNMYFDLSMRPLKERKASFRNASSKNQSGLWRTQLALVLVTRPDLNEGQKQIILSAMSLVTPGFFEVRATNPAWNTKVGVPLRALEEQILSAFSFEEAAKIFAQLGDDSEAALRTPAGAVLLSTIKYHRISDSGPSNDRSRNQLAAQDMWAGGPCECSLNDDWCPITSYCGGTNCSPTQSGCGTFWSVPCNGASCR